VIKSVTGLYICTGVFIENQFLDKACISTFEVGQKSISKLS